MRDLAKLPKAHLHLHFTGSMRRTTLVELAAASGRRLPGAFSLNEPLHLPGGQRGWFRFQRLYDAAAATVLTQDNLRRIVQEATEDDAREGSGRLEIQIDPTTYAAHVGGTARVLEVVQAAARDASASTGVEVGVIVAASRLRHPLDARALARLAARASRDEGGRPANPGGQAVSATAPGAVIGFGLSNDENRGLTSDFAPAFEIARRAGLLCLPHGGELRGPDHVRQVMRWLKPDRLGHGVRAAEDPEVLRAVVEAGVTLEICPLSNVALGVYDRPADVPLRTLLNAGARVTLNADDPLIFGYRLLDQYESARHDHGLSDAVLAQLATNSILASRASPPVRARLLAGVEAWLNSP